MKMQGWVKRGAAIVMAMAVLLLSDGFIGYKVQTVQAIEDVQTIEDAQETENKDIQETADTQQGIEDTQETADTQEAEDERDLETEDTQETEEGDTQVIGEKTINLRMIVTSDLHGQMTGKDYETGQTSSHAGMERLLTGIEEARAEVLEDNSFTFDVGDVLFDFTTENIFTSDSTALQPIWKAYQKMGYDAFTLGNHDFDYGYGYIVQQLVQSGMEDQCVVSNLWKTASGEYPFNETMTLTRVVKAEDGTEILIEIGIIGETIPVLSQKTEVLTGQLTTENILENTRKKAKMLKEEGVDLVVVLAHSGFGAENPSETDANVAYALTKIPEVDVVMAGHEHKTFPGGNGDEVVYAMSGADRETGLVNEKPLVMPGARADQIGVVDLCCSLEGMDLTVTSAHTEVRTVDKVLTKQAEEINEQLYGDFLEMLTEHSTKTVATVAEGITYHNYFGMIQDNAAIQLVNDAKIAYGLKYQHSLSGSAYADLPVVACSGYTYYGQSDDSDYATVDESRSGYFEVSDRITGASVSDMQSYHAYIVIYQVTGAQLREYMEWAAAGAYAVPGEEEDWDGPLPPLIAAGWRENWSYFQIFDGVEYTINPSILPRYDFNGNKINNTHRITSLTINGKELDDSDKLLLCCDRIIKTTPASQDIISDQLKGGYVSSQNYFISWLEERAKVGNIDVVADQNWSLKLPSGFVFLVETGLEGDRFAAGESWYVNTLVNEQGRKFYCGGLQNGADKIGPNLVVTPDVTLSTNNDVVLAVEANDVSGLAKLQYYEGEVMADDEVWNTASKVENNQVTVKQNGIYTFRAEDSRQNVSLTKVSVTNIDKTILQIPTVVTYTNRKAAIQGTAEPNATVYIKVSGKTYSTQVEEDGSFSYALPSQPSGTKIQLYVKDSRGRASDTVTIQVKRTGPNRPTISVAIQNIHTQVKGKLKDDDALPIVIIGDYVYGSEESLNRYRYSDIYDAEKMLQEMEVTISKSGVYTVKIPAQPVGTQVTVYTIDSLFRGSRRRSVVVQEGGPDSPVIYHPSNAERQISGMAVEPKSGERYDVKVTSGGKTWEGRTEEDGSFCIEVGMMTAGSVYEVVLFDEKDGTKREGAPCQITVTDYQNYENGQIIVDTLTGGDSTVAGFYQAEAPLTIMIDVTRYEAVCDENGRFEVALKRDLFNSSLVFVIAREDGTLKSIHRVDIVPR